MLHEFYFCFIFWVSGLNRYHTSSIRLFQKIKQDFEVAGKCKIKNISRQVYFHKDDFGFFPNDNSQCRDNCKFTNNISDSDVVLWHTVTQKRPTLKLNQILIAVSMEPGSTSKKLNQLNANLTASFSYNSDIIYSYLEDFFYKNLESGQLPTNDEFNEMKFAVFIQSNCGSKPRINFVKELMSFVHIESRGACLNNAPRIKGHWTKIMNEIKNKYKFYIAIESMDQDDYFTEKFQNGFVVNSIPVYYGPDGTNIYVPSKSFLRIPSLNSSISLINKKPAHLISPQRQAPPPPSL